MVAPGWIRVGGAGKTDKCGLRVHVPLGFLRQRVFSQINCGDGCTSVTFPNTLKSPGDMSGRQVM